MRNEDEFEFDSICFHKECIKQGEQLFSQTNYTQALTHAIHKELCKPLKPEEFQHLYKIPNKLASKVMKKFQASLNKEIKRRQKDCQSSFIRVYKEQAKKAYLNCMKRFAFSDCSKIMQKLMRRKKILKAEETVFLTNLFEQNQLAIQVTMDIKLAQLVDQLAQLGETILKVLENKIKDIFFEAFSQIPIKQEDQSSSNSYQYKQQIKESNHGLQMRQQSDQSMAVMDLKEQKNAIQHIQYESSEVQPIRKKRKARLKHVDEGNIIESQRPRRNGKVNYFNYNQYGNHSKEDFFQKAYIVNSPADIKNYSKSKNRQIQQYHVLIINWKIEFEELIELINFIKPKRIKINAQIIDFEENLLSRLSKPILHTLVQFEQSWDREHFTISYANCTFSPQKKKVYPFSKINFNSENWNSLLNLENIWISSLSDIQSIIDSSKNLDNLKCLKIEPLNDAILFSDELRQNFGGLTNLRTLIIKNITFDKVFNEFVIKLIKNNPIKCLILKKIQNISQDCISHFAGLNLTQLIIHLNERPQNLDFNDILRISTLTSLSLKGVSIDSSTSRHSLYDTRHILKNLEHLDLCTANSGLTYNGILRCLHSINHKNIRYLNLDGNALEQAFAYILKQFTNLVELNISRTSLNLLNLLNNLKEPIRSVEKMTLSGYYDAEDERETDNKSLLEDQALRLLFEMFPNIKYLNISSPLSVPKARFHCPFSSLSVNGVKQPIRKKNK